eukprot:g2908.t1
MQVARAAMDELKEAHFEEINKLKREINELKAQLAGAERKHSNIMSAALDSPTALAQYLEDNDTRDRCFDHEWAGLYHTKVKCMDINSLDTKIRGECCIVKSIGDRSNGPHREVVTVGILAESAKISTREDFELLQAMHCVPANHREHGWRGTCYGWLFAGLVPTSVWIKFSPKGTNDRTRGQR